MTYTHHPGGSECLLPKVPVISPRDVEVFYKGGDKHIQFSLVAKILCKRLPPMTATVKIKLTKRQKRRMRRLRVSRKTYKARRTDAAGLKKIFIACSIRWDPAEK